ncbi:Caveolin-1 protein [Quillaja saponaria]|uniref:Caveolin-1 protein n=1 Tax=Quillaja saponaria TaxID=32244 RepID=A0AAD7LIT5_QUISA|nr:Caveolin-1 protein [Quillaja saponaria]
MLQSNFGVVPELDAELGVSLNYKMHHILVCNLFTLLSILNIIIIINCPALCLGNDKWYEVKISYPASIPASFSLQLRRDYYQSGLYVLVAVEREGFVAIPNVAERRFIIFNIVCDELLLGIPHSAWSVVLLVLLCLGLAFLVLCFLPPSLLPKNPSAREASHSVSKDS